MSQPTGKFANFAAARDQVCQCLEAIAQCYAELDALPRAEQLRKLNAALKSDAFKVLILGEFKRGKSTFINALLGQKLLPAKVAPCTAVITRVRFSPERTAILHFRDGREPLTLDLEKHPNALEEHLTIFRPSRRHGVPEAPSRTAPGDDGSPADCVNPYAAAEVFFPLDLCRNNVEVVDSPGLNEHQTRTEVTRGYLFEADALIVVLSCEQFLSETEKQFIARDLQDRDFRDVFFLCTRYSAIRDSPSDQLHFDYLVKEHIEPHTKGRPRVHFVDGLEALTGRLKGDAELVAASNLPAFEEALETFLATERGRVKLRTPVRACENAIQEAVMNLLPQREELIKTPVEELKKRLETERPRLAEIEKQHERMLRTIERRSEALLREAEGSFRTLTATLENGLRRQAAGLDVSKWEAIKNRQEMGTRIDRQLKDWVGEECRRWQRESLQPLMEQQWKNLIEELDEQAEEFLMNLETFRSVFQLETGKSLAERQETSPLSRMLGAGIGLVAGGIGSALEGASLGAGAMAKGLAVNAMTAFGLIHIVGLTVPMALPVLMAIGVFRTMSGAQRTIEETKEAVIEQVAADLKSSHPKIEADLREQICEFSKSFAAKINDRMTALVDEIRGQVESVIREREQQQQSAEQQIGEINTFRTKLFEYRDRIQSAAASMEL